MQLAQIVFIPETIPCIFWIHDFEVGYSLLFLLFSPVLCAWYLLALAGATGASEFQPQN